MSYQKVSGTINPGGHPGSYNGQDAYNDLLITNDGNGNRHGDRSGERRNHVGGGCPTLNVTSEQPIMVSDRKGHNGITEDGTSTTLTAQEKDRPVVGTSIVRRLTPLECCRLQGFPDNWTRIGTPEMVEVKDYDYAYEEEGNEIGKVQTGTHKEIAYFYIDDAGKKKKVTDSAEYRAYGNSICLPFWQWLMKRISAQYERRATLGSLFDGIGGFPLCWARVNGPDACIWASEIEPFCIAVTKRHFGDDEKGTKGDIREFL